MKVAFWENQLCERGTSISLYDYAYFNEEILNNESIIFYDKCNRDNKLEIIDKFKKRFKVIGVNNFEEVDPILLDLNIRHIYIIKAGHFDGKLSAIAKNCIHCVFHCYQPHGNVYSSISPWVKGNEGKYPVVPHMIHLPSHSYDLKEELGIPKNANVFGGYGGKDSFNIPFVQNVVYHVAKNNPSIYFLFANFNKFCYELPNIKFLPMITDLNEKVKFINTCDAMLWGRSGGETFGISIGEFSTLNKPVIATKECGGDLSHVHLLGNKAIWYSNEKDLTEILVNFDRSIENKKDWNAYKDYNPKKVIEIFNEIYLQD